jgi:cytochrome bd-type quinol oxidase subunit 2
MMELIDSGEWLPYIFALLIGISFLAYAILDGYDLGVGMLCAFCGLEERDSMISSIGPFWDANETWLVLGVGLLLVAFPPAHGIVLTNLYLPVGIMLVALIFRGVSFDFRKKAPPQRQPFWMPFAVAVFIFIFGFVGMVYSFHPYIIPGQLKIVDAAAAPESLLIILVGTVIVLPCLIGYTALAYYVFRGKATELTYD